MIKPEVVNQLKAIHELQLLLYLSKVDSWTHNKSSRTVLADSLSIAEVTLKVALKKMKNKGFILRESKGIYKLNNNTIQ